MLFVLMNCKGTEAENHTKIKTRMAGSFWRHKKIPPGNPKSNRRHRQRNQHSCLQTLRINRRGNWNCGREVEREDSFSNLTKPQNCVILKKRKCPNLGHLRLMVIVAKKCRKLSFGGYFFTLYLFCRKRALHKLYWLLIQ